MTSAALPLVCPACRAPIEADDRGARCGSCGAVYPVEEGILRLVAGSAASPGYDPHFFAALPEAEDRHFWFVTRRELILDVLRRTVPDLDRRPLFDVGCGTGGLLQYLAAAGIGVAGACDAYVDGLRLARRRVAGPLLLVDEGRLPPLAAGQAMIGLFDVLEHIDDDRGTLDWAWSVLEPGGVLVSTVPAHPSLYDERDAAACHRRRYRRSELRAKLLGAGFEIRALTHFMAPLAVVLFATSWLGRRLGWRRGDGHAQWQRDLRVHPLRDRVLRAVLGLERYVIRSVDLPFGSSLLAVAARPAGAGAADASVV